MFKKAVSIILTAILFCCMTACSPQTSKEVKLVPATKNVEKVVDVTSTVQKPVTTTESVQTVTDIVKLKIDNLTPVQENYLGFNAVHEGFFMIPDDYGRDYTDEQIEEELKRIKESGLNMVRSYYEPNYCVSNVNGQIVYNWESSEMQGLYKWLTALKKMNVTVALNIGWGVTDLFTRPNSPNELANPYHKFDYEDVINYYSDFAVKTVEEVIIKRGFDNVKYFVMFTEPKTNDKETIYKDGKSIGQKDTYEVYVETVKAASKALTDKKYRGKYVKLVGPNAGISTNFYTNGGCENVVDELQWFIDRLDNYLDVYSLHWYIPTWPGNNFSSEATQYDDNYHTWTYYFEGLVEAVKKTGKPYWFDEWNYAVADTGYIQTDFYGNQIAQCVVATMNSGVQSSLYWQMFKNVWPHKVETSREFLSGIQQSGLGPSLYESAIPFKSYYAFSLLTKYGGNFGSKVYAGSSRNGICLSMVEYEENGKTVQSIIVVNASSLSKNISIELDKAIGATMYRHLWDPTTCKPTTAARVIDIDKAFKNVGNVLQDTLPSGAVAVYTTTKD